MSTIITGRTSTALKTTATQPATLFQHRDNKETSLRNLEQCSSRRGMNIYEYLAIPTFIRQGKIIKAGW